MLSTNIQKAIKQSYLNLSSQLDGFIPRRAQNYLVAEIAKTLSGTYHKSNRIIVAEAGTGIGKSLAYLMACVPFAQFSQKKIIISTATVALQEQLIHKDMPLYRRLVETPFSFILAKGRQRYCCLEKLSLACGKQPEQGEQQLAMFDSTPKTQDLAQLHSLYNAFMDNKWDGDRDSWAETIPDDIWKVIVSDKHSCNNSMPMHRDCPFQKARADLDKADVIIANHSLVMADADLGGGVILPEPEQSIYVFDEAHHLPNVAREHASAAASLKGATTWLESLNKAIVKIANLTDVKRSARFRNELQDAIQQLIPTLTQLSKQFNPSEFKENVYRFEHGELPPWLEEESKSLKILSKKAHQSMAKITDLISERVKDGELSSRLAEPALAESGFYLQRLENLAKVWHLMAEPNHDKGAPLARWIEVSTEREDDFFINVSPLEVGWQLDKQLWSRCAGAVLVSATMRALNSFQFFAIQAGISQKEADATQFLALASPFDYENNAELVVPKLKHEPQHPDFTKYLSEILPTFIQDKKANLVLFSSYWQMNQVAQALESNALKNKWNLQVQGKQSRGEILNKHRAYCQFGQTSVIFGTGSFSEGLDLPGKLLENLIITKIPFGVPTSPVEQAHSEYIVERGGNPFMQISVPEASKKLIQSVGRLLRKEQDSGRVVILDRRIVTKRYGKALLDALPPFTRKVEY